VLAEWKWKAGILTRTAMALVKVDGKKIKANTFYVLKNKKIVEAD